LLHFNKLETFLPPFLEILDQVVALKQHPSQGRMDPFRDPSPQTNGHSEAPLGTGLA
jgi:hypothetical protein